MNVLTKIKKIDQKIESMKKRAGMLHTKEYALSGKRTAAFLEYALEHGLRESTWEVKLQYRADDIPYAFHLTSDTNDFPALIKNWKCDYHASVELKKGVNLYINDGTLDLHFSTPEMAQEFIQEHGLDLNLDAIKEELKKAQEKVETLSGFLRQNGE